MDLPWIKLYLEARTDPKLQSGLTGEQFRVWFNLLLLAAVQPCRGVIESPNDEWLSTEVSGGNIELLETTLLRLSDLRMISLEKSVAFRCNPLQSVASRCIALHNFEKRQSKRGPRGGLTSTERSRKCREKKKLEKTESTEPLHAGAPARAVEGIISLNLEKKEIRDIEESVACDATDSEIHTQNRKPEESETLSPSRPPMPGGKPGCESEFLPSTPRRTAEERAMIEAARKILAQGLDTEVIARELDRLEDQAGYASIPAWKFHVAAERQVLISDPGKRRSSRYYFAIVRGLGDDERYAAPRASRKDRDPPLDPETYTYHRCTPERMAELEEEYKRIGQVNRMRSQGKR